MNYLMYMDDIKLFFKKKRKELKIQIRKLRVYSDNIGIEFGIEIYHFHMRSGKCHISEGIELSNGPMNKTNTKRKDRRHGRCQSKKQTNYRT